MINRFLATSVVLIWSTATPMALSAAEIKIGVLTTLSGPMGDGGRTIVEGVRRASDELNSISGRTYSFVSVDDACDPQVATSAALQLIDSGVAAVIGGYCSDATAAAATALQPSGVPFIVTGTSPALLAPIDSENTFLIHGDEVARATEVLKTKGDTSLTIVSEAPFQHVAKLVGDSFIATVGNSVKYLTVANPRDGFDSEVQTITETSPHAVLWIGNDLESVGLVTELHDKGYEGQTYLWDSSGSTDLYQSLGPAAAGLYVLSSPSAESLSYDGTMLLGSAIAAAGTSDNDRVIAALQNANFTAATTGTISFTEKKTLMYSNIVLLQGLDGDFAPIEDRGHTCPAGQHECRVTDCCPN